MPLGRKIRQRQAGHHSNSVRLIISLLGRLYCCRNHLIYINLCKLIHGFDTLSFDMDEVGYNIYAVHKIV